MRVQGGCLWRRVAQSEARVPFQPLMPMRLRDHVSGKGGGAREVACLQPMFDLISCLKENEYSQKPCADLNAKFDECWMNHLREKRAYKQSLNRGDLNPLPQQKRNTIKYQQLNVYLKKFPTP